LLTEPVHILNSSDEQVKQKLSRAEKFDSVLTFQQQKARFPELRQYCETNLGLTFKGDYSYCPIHVGHTGHSFEVTDATQKWHCWSKCRDRCARHGNGESDRTQPCTCRGDVLDLHMLCFEFESKREAIASLINGSESLKGRAAKFLLLTVKPKAKPAKFVVNERLVARALRGFAFATPDYVRSKSDIRNPVASDFAQMLLRQFLAATYLPIVFFTKYKAIIGRRAVDALQRIPDRLQYVGRWTARSEKGSNPKKRGSNTLDNLKERLFVNVEFDDMPLEKQLKLLWYLKVRGEWRMISITFSGSGSYHGLFLVRGFSEERIKRMKRMALSLGACKSCTQEHIGVRFPSGWRTAEDWCQTGVGRQEILYLSPLSV
jgi:hypothetical protein